MKVALVHDYILEFGGAERVLEALCEIYPDAPIYTSFYKEGSPFYERFKNKDIRVSWAHFLPGFSTFFHSPLRFLAPLIWNSFDFSQYDLVITSASWYITKGVRKGKRTIEICYCHTPPRYLYGYNTSVPWQKYWPIKLYGNFVNHFLRLYDYASAQKVDYFIANSKEVASRIKKFYRRDAVVIYPPVDLASPASNLARKGASFAYFLIVSRIVGSKNLELAVKAANKAGFKLKIAGQGGGYGREFERLKKIGGKNVEFLGFVNDNELARLYKDAKGFLALSQDEDFGITPVEAMLAGTPVVAYRGGGYVESVISGKTGVFFEKPTVDSLIEALKKLDAKKWDRLAIAKYAAKFSKERFKKEILAFVKSTAFVKSKINIV